MLSAFQGIRTRQLNVNIRSTTSVRGLPVSEAKHLFRYLEDELIHVIVIGSNLCNKSFQNITKKEKKKNVM